jgi:hypothetical protein
MNKKNLHIKDYVKETPSKMMLDDFCTNNKNLRKRTTIKIKYPKGCVKMDVVCYPNQCQ